MFVGCSFMFYVCVIKRVENAKPQALQSYITILQPIAMDTIFFCLKNFSTITITAFKRSTRLIYYFIKIRLQIII